MVNPRQRRKSRAPAHKKTRPSRHAQRNLRKMKPIRGPQVLRDAWDNKKTVKQNYDAIGLVGSLKMSDPGGTEKNTYPPPQTSNTSTHSHMETSGEREQPPSFGRIIRDEIGRIIDVQLPEENTGKPTESDESEGDGDHLRKSLKDGVVQALEQLAQTARPVERHTSEAETTALNKMIAKHGHDYDAMAKDLRLNRWQRTSGQLQRACKKAGLV